MPKICPPGILEKIHAVFSQRHVIVKAQILQTRDTLGYMIVDIKRNQTEHIPELLNRLTETIKVRQIDWFMELIVFFCIRQQEAGNFWLNYQVRVSWILLLAWNIHEIGWIQKYSLL